MSTETETKQFKDAALAAVKEALGSNFDDMFAAGIEKAYSGREAALEQQFKHQFLVERAAADWDEATEGKAPIGAVIAAMAINRGDRAATMEDVRKYLGPTLEKTVNLSEATEGGVLIQADVLAKFFDALAPQTAMLRLGPTIVPIDNGTVNVPGWTGRPTFSWVGETNTADVSSTPSSGMRALNQKKGMAIIEVTNSVIRTGLGSYVAQYVENAARREVGLGLDIAYIRGAGTQHTPKGMRYWASNTSAMTATPTFVTALTDVRTAFTKIAAANGPLEKMAWIWAPRTEYWLMWGALDGFNHPYFSAEMAKGTFMGRPFAATNNVPTNLGGGGNESELYLLDMAHVLIGQVGAGGIIVDWFREGSYTSGGVVRSLMERDSQAVRVVVQTDINTTYTQAHHVTTGLTWGA